MNPYAGSIEARGVLARPDVPVNAGPQLLSALTDHVRSLHELRARLVNINKQLRGSTPQPPNEANAKEPELHMTNVISALARVIEQCHGESSEISALLS